MKKIAAILMVSVMAMAILTPTVYAACDVDTTAKSTTGVQDSDCSTWLEKYDWLQFIEVGSNGVIDDPDPTKPNYIGGDDMLLDNSNIGKGFPFATNGRFRDDVLNSCEGHTMYVRAWNGNCGDWEENCPFEDAVASATHYGDSHTWTVPTTTPPYEHDYGTWCTTIPKPEPTPESKLVSMSVGWNAVSLCFEPSSNATADVLSSISSKYDAVKEWNGGWAEATTMDRGRGYFVYINTACQWNHTGTNVTESMIIPLETGLNLVGYPFNWNKDTGTALSALNYYYAAPYNAVNQAYEDTYNPAAPAAFNDFMTVSPCEGFWVSSEDGVDWTAS